VNLEYPSPVAAGYVLVFQQKIAWSKARSTVEANTSEIAISPAYRVEWSISTIIQMFPLEDCGMGPPG